MPSDIYQADPPRRPPVEAREQQHREDSSATLLTSTARPRTANADTAEIDETLSHPGSVRINVKGAFIVDQDTATPTTPDGRSGSPGRHETKDIRLPNHTAVVSHIAIDVCGLPWGLLRFALCCR
jgi:type II pantothenate kinase